MSDEKLTGYSLAKSWFAECHKCHQIKPIHTALYYWITYVANQTGYAPVFGLPTDFTMHQLGISNYKTYKKALDFLEEIKVIEVVERSKNQFTSNKIALVKNTKALPKALPIPDTKALPKALPKALYEALLPYITIKTIKLIKLINLETLKEIFEKSENGQSLILGYSEEEGLPQQDKEIIQEWETDLMQDEDWIEETARHYQIERSKLIFLLSKFTSEKILTNTATWKYFDGFKKNFFFWIKSGLTKNYGKSENGIDEERSNIVDKVLDSVPEIDINEIEVEIDDPRK